MAARGGLDGTTFAWGDVMRPEKRIMANTWQGQLPWKNTKEDGRERTSPVGSFPSNGYGLSDMIGNVWSGRRIGKRQVTLQTNRRRVACLGILLDQA
jgi:sulfatase modifying factor 1